VGVLVIPLDLRAGRAAVQLATDLATARGTRVAILGAFEHPSFGVFAAAAGPLCVPYTAHDLEADERARREALVDGADVEVRCRRGGLWEAAAREVADGAYGLVLSGVCGRGRLADWRTRRLVTALERYFGAELRVVAGRTEEQRCSKG
jgi:hypothetical protein